MMMKQLFRHTSTLLRTALLLGALTFVNTPQATAQALQVTEDMPSAFDFMNPGDVIGDGNYYYIQFYFGSDISYLSDQGAGNALRSKDYIPFAKNLQWTLVSTGTANQFKLKSLNGIFAYLDDGAYKGTTDENTASTFTFYNHSGGGYDIGTTEISDKAMAGNDNTGPWVAVYNNPKGNARCRLRVGKLKDNVAHIIYWQEPIYKDGNVVDRNTNTRGGSAGFTQHHYLTNSGTNDNRYDISSRKSILWYYDVWQLPTAAAYHQDGLWTLESAGSDGEFYIKKYGSSGEYLNYNGSNASILGTKNPEYGKYVLESPGANRYTRIQSSTKFVADALTADMFYEWNGCRADATITGSHRVDIYFGNNTDLSPGETVYGDDWHVNYLNYADLTGYSKIVFEGTAGLELRVLLNRDVPNGGDADGGAFLDRRCTIGTDGRAEVDLSDLAFAHLNSIKVQGGSGQVSSITLVKPNYDVTSLTNSQFYNWDGYGADASSTSWTSVTFNVGNSVTLNPWDVVVGTGEVKCLVYADLTGTAKMVFEGTPGMQLRIQMNRQVDDNGPITERNTTIGEFGKAEVDLSDLPYIHLNAIKVANGSPSGTISSIKLLSPNSGGNNLFMSCANTDGNAVTQKSGTPDDYWYAGFLPVEVPVPNKDEFYQVVMGLNPKTKNQIALTGGNMTVSNQVYAGEKVIGATFTPTGAYQNAFQYKNFNTRSYKQIVIKFGSEVTSGWTLHTYGGQWEGNDDLAGKMEYTVTLKPGTKIDDFTIYNTDANASPLTISEIYFTPDLPLQMLNHSGGTSDYSEEEDECQLWQLEQVDDYTTFRVKDKSTGKYLKGAWQMTEPNDPDNAETKNIDQYLSDFYIKWFFISPAVKEIPVEHYVRHKESYLRTYAEAITDQKGLKKQGLATDIDSDWKNFNGNFDGFTQNVNHFEITHYVKMGDSRVIEFPTVLNKNNDHVYYQRFYNYGELDEHMNLDNLKAHVSLDTRDDGDVQYFLYKNGMVTGQKLDWSEIEAHGLARNAQRRFNFTNSDGEQFTVAVDVSRYSDLKYLNPTTHLEGDLMEPSLTMRYLFHMNDAKEMAARLTACSEGSGNWLEGNKVFHFGRTQVPYTKFKKVGYRGEFIPIRHIFSDYWVYDDPQLLDSEHLSSLGLTGEALSNYLDQHLVSAVNDNNGGKIEVEIDPNGTGIRKGGYNPNVDLNSEEVNAEGNDADYQGFYFYDLLSPSPKHEYGNSRFIAFRYPEGGIVNSENPAYIKVYLNNNGTRYQIAQFTIYFDANMATRPWTKVKNGTHYANGIDCVKGSSRDPNKLRMRAGHPIAKVSFDYPQNTTYHYPTSDICPNTDGSTKHDGGTFAAGGTIANSSPVPLTFNHTNYAFDGNGANWGSYALVTQKRTTWGNDKDILPADDAEYGYNIDADPGMQKAFLYIDASEQPGDICAVDFEGEFCSGDQLMCSGWISGSNKMRGDTRCPGSITLTVKGGNADGTSTNTIYRFCPGQIYELDNGYGDEGYVEGETPDTSTDIGTGGVDGGTGDYVVWQQFYFEFSTDQKYERYWLEVNNNCVSSNGGDFMLDNVEVYTIVPEVTPEINTPLCVSVDENGNTQTEMRLLKLNVDYNKLKSSSTATSGKAKVGFVFLEKEVFLKELWNRKHLQSTYADLDAFAKAVEEGDYLLADNDVDYRAAFDKALLGNKDIWNSSPNPNANKGAGIMYFEWDTNFEAMTQYSFADAVNKRGATFRYTDNEGVQWLVLNGNYPGLPWKTNTQYYIVPTNSPIVHGVDDVYSIFNICSECSKASTFQIEPPYTVLGLEKSEGTEDYVVCEGQIPTVALNLKGYDLNGNPVDMKDLNFDWWLGDNTAEEPEDRLATLENYHAQAKNGVKLDEALAALRSYYPYITSLDGVIEHLDKTPNLSEAQVLYLQEVVKAGQLVLHQSSISVPAERASNDDPYFYLVACPIHDEAFNQALNPQDHQYVGYFCDEPQGLRIKVGQKAPTLKTGFVPNEHGFSSYDYQFPEGTDPVLSIRLAKAAQFETVKNENDESATPSTTVNYLWLPIRNAKTETADMVIQKAQDDNIYLASTNDPTWDKKISTEMRDNGLLPIVGRIVQLQAINTKDNSEGAAEGATLNVNENANNRLCVYFTENFDVREGYNYTLSLPFQEQGDVNTCDGTILINLKIVPDYEVWTGAAGNTDWNNDENWRRADGNTTDNSGVNGDELYVAAAEDGSPLKGYKTNSYNYRSLKDRIFRKGFAPLYCTHILMKSDEWGNAPVLYDAIDGKSLISETNSRLINSPFPNLRDTSTPILKFDMQARRYDMWKDTYGTDPDRGSADRTNDLIAEMYQINSCDEIAMQPGTELLNAHLLNYNSAWMEFELDTKRWYLLGSPLQGIISGEWYAPTGTAQQKTTYYDNVTFGSGYDRYAPAIYQRSWDKAKAVLYEVGAGYATTDDSQTENLGNSWEGSWNNDTWKDPTGETDGTGADDYLDRLGYRPFGAKKANVAIKGIWSNTYNDAQVDYAKGGFSVMVMNHLKPDVSPDASGGKAIIRLPKEDTMYDYYKFSEDGSDDGGTDTNFTGEQGVQKKGRALNRGRLKTDLLLPTQDGIQKQEKEAATYRYGDRRTYTRIPIKEADLNTMNGGTFSFTEKVDAGASNLVYYLVENPFPCGLDMTKFFDNESNSSLLEKKYWILTKGDGQNPRQVLVQQAGNEWVSQNEGTFTTAKSVVAPGQGFFVEAKTANAAGITVTFTDEMQAQSRFGEIDGNGRTFTYVIGQSQKTKKMYDADDDGIPDTDVPDPDNYEGGELIMVDTDGDNVPDTPKTVVIVLVYQTDNQGQYVLDDNQNKIPVLQDITETVKLYNYKQTSDDDKKYKLLTRTRGEGVEAILPGLVITAQRDDSETSALVMQRGGASNDFLPEEDTEAFINSDFENAPTVYTLCGRLATTINSIHDFRSLPIGVESTSDAPCTLTFRGVEMLGDSISFYDAVEQKLTPLESGMQVSVSGQTQNRYYLVRGLNLKEAAEETHLQIFTEGLTAKVIASTAEPILVVRCFDTSGRLLYTANPDSAEHSFTLPGKGIYIIEAQTENDRKTKKVMTK